ncbi:hypothetical protein SARC_12521, partial [Sphaeroforma arctica JP610]
MEARIVIEVDDQPPALDRESKILSDIIRKTVMSAIPSRGNRVAGSRSQRTATRVESSHTHTIAREITHVRVVVIVGVESTEEVVVETSLIPNRRNRKLRTAHVMGEVSRDGNTKEATSQVKWCGGPCNTWRCAHLARDRYAGPPLKGIDGMGTLAPEFSVPWDDLEAYLVILGNSHALAEGHPFSVVENIPMGCDILIGYDQMQHSKWALMWCEDELIVVPHSAIKWSWLKGTIVPLSPQVKLLFGFRQPKPRAR